MAFAVNLSPVSLRSPEFTAIRNKSPKSIISFTKKRPVLSFAVTQEPPTTKPEIELEFIGVNHFICTFFFHFYSFVAFIRQYYKYFTSFMDFAMQTNVFAVSQQLLPMVTYMLLSCFILLLVSFCFTNGVLPPFQIQCSLSNCTD